MIKTVVVLVFATACLAQKIAEKKCKEYQAAAKALPDAVQCKPLTKSINNEILNAPSMYPGYVTLGYVDDELPFYKICEGVLISEDTVVTLTNCVTRPDGEIYPNVVLLGNQTNYVAEISIRKKTTHPQFSQSTNHNDIAIVKLEKKVPHGIIPTCLDTTGVQSSESVVAVGVAMPASGPLLELLEKGPIAVELVLVPTDKCNQLVKPKTSATEGEVCTLDPAKGIGACLGGNLYVNREPCVHTVAALSARGPSCPIDNIPSIFTRITTHLPWIERNTWPEEFSAH